MWTIHCLAASNCKEQYVQPVNVPQELTTIIYELTGDCYMGHNETEVTPSITAGRNVPVESTKIILNQ